MPLSLPPTLVEAKNRLYSDSSFLELLEIQMLSGEVLRIANNNDDVIWGGHTWSRFAFESGDDKETAAGEDHSVSVQVSNVSGAVQGYLESSDNGMLGDTVIYRLVHPASISPAVTGRFEVVDAVANQEWVTFTLGAENWFMNRFPAHVYSRDRCWYDPDMTDTCPYTNSSVCDRKFATCIALGQSSISGCQPGIPGGAFNV
jgi:phage-related protein